MRVRAAVLQNTYIEIVSEITEHRRLKAADLWASSHQGPEVSGLGSVLLRMS